VDRERSNLPFGDPATSDAGRELKALLNATVDAVIVIDFNGVIMTFNRAAERLFGYEAAEIVGNRINALMPEPYRSAHHGYLQAYLRTGQARIIGIGREVVAQRKDGTVFPASLAVGEIEGSDPRRFVGFIHDITTRKSALEALRRERDRAQSYLDLAQVILVAIDSAGQIVLINRKGCEILGYTEAELIGRDWFEHFVPKAQRDARRAALREALDAAAAAAGPTYAEDPVLTREDVPKLIAWRNTVIRDEFGRAVGQLSSGEDVTEARRYERALIRSESLLRSAQAIANLGNFEVDAADGPAYWSEQLYRILGCDPAAGPVPARDFGSRFVHADDLDRFNGDLARAMHDTGWLDTEFRIVRPSGEIRTIHALGQTSHLADGTQTLKGTLHDITDRRIAEDEMRQGQDKLTHVARLSTMGEMATGLAHEINQPLTAIATYAQAAVRMLDAAGGAPSEDVREAMIQITNQALRAGEVIRRLRTFVKNRATQSETVDMNRLIQELRVLAEPDARASDVRLVLDLAPALPPVAADPIQIQQVLLNLIRNAIDATLERPDAAREIVVRTALVADEVETSVTDHGPGIRPEIAENLFNPFFTTKTAGTGLGLAISRSIIRAHRGKLSYHPRPGGGTVFVFTLPSLPGV
jgi:two-component system, LuxR family, sensor kinase FixL